MTLLDGVILEVRQARFRRHVQSSSYGFKHSTTSMQSNTNNLDLIDSQYRLDIIQHQPFLEFLWKYLKPLLDKKEKEPFTILEVGCGNGVFAKLLLNRVKEHQLSRSVEYTAIDPVSDCAKRAKELGINAFASDFFTFVEGKENLRYDMILFTKSLHHVLPVDKVPFVCVVVNMKAVALASSCLKEHGVFIADEFDRTLADEETTRWFFESSELLQAADVFDLSKVTHHMHVHTQGEPHQHAHSHSHSHSHSHGHGEHHQCKHSAKIEPQDSSFLSKFNTMFLRHELATWAQIQKAVKDTFDEVQVTESLPSLFTMFAPRLVISESAEKVLKTLMKIEEERIRDKHLTPIGVRIIATHHKGEI